MRPVLLCLSAIMFMVPQASAQDNEISVPEGFEAAVIADNLGFARHLAARENAQGGVDLYVALRRQSDKGGGIVALRDGDNDGQFEEQRYFGDVRGTGIHIKGDDLYFGTNTMVLKYKLSDALIPADPPDIIVSGFPAQRQHAAKSIALDQENGLYVNVGAPSNACQEKARTKGSPGLTPCPQLERQAGIWRFDANKTGQTQEDGVRYATGIRNAVALDWDNDSNALYFAQHGRDQLSQLWGEFYSDAENAEKPAEEFHRASMGSHHGWPYTYYDREKSARMLAPEYGGDGRKTDASDEYSPPLEAFPGHWGPNDLIFYNHQAFPSEYQQGAFIAFHGSWNRAPLPQGGYKIVFVPMKNGEAVGDWSVFADGFKGKKLLSSPRDARYRPTGLAIGPMGALYISDSLKGRIWRVTYEGE